MPRGGIFPVVFVSNAAPMLGVRFVAVNLVANGVPTRRSTVCCRWLGLEMLRSTICCHRFGLEMVHQC